MAALLYVVELCGDIVPPLPQLVYGTEALCPLLLHGMQLIREPVHVHALGGYAVVQRGNLCLQLKEASAALLYLILAALYGSHKATGLALHALCLVFSGVCLFLEGHQGYLLLGSLVVHIGGFRPELIQLLLKLPYVVLACHVALLPLRAVLVGLTVLLVYIFYAVVYLGEFKPCLLHLVPVFLYVLLHHVHLFAVRGKLYIRRVQRLRRLFHGIVGFGYIAFQLSKLDLGPFKLFPLLFQRRCYGLYLPLTAYQAELPLLGAAAGHAAAGVYYIAL